MAGGRWVLTGGGGYELLEVVPQTWTHLLAVAAGCSDAHIGFARQTRPILIGYDGLGPGVIAVVSVGHARCQ